MHASDIIAYTYRADQWHRDCVVRALYGEGRAAPAALDMDSESVLAQIAGAEGIDHQDEHTFDSDNFPKVVFADAADDMLDDTCGGCGEPIIEGTSPADCMVCDGDGVVNGMPCGECNGDLYE